MVKDIRVFKFLNDEVFPATDEVLGEGFRKRI